VRIISVTDLLIAIGIGCSFASTGRGGDTPSSSPIVATVNGVPILASEVERELQIALGTRKLDTAARDYLQTTTLKQLVSRRLIIQWLQATDRGASTTEVDLEISRLNKRLQARGVTLTEQLASRQIAEPEMRRLLEWKIGWRKFLARYLTDDNLAKYFNDHRRDFDGTRMRVAHILLKIKSGDASDEQRAVRLATEIRESIISKTTTFADAAKRFSAAPTSDKGGEIGFIERHKPMHAAFSRAAFALSKHETSPPVVTPFGVHLIHCLEIEPGQRIWQETREDLATAVTQYLFEWAAEKERSTADIRILELSSD
jgi:parvulin-like peptidyl-prolyl isomerase